MNPFLSAVVLLATGLLLQASDSPKKELPLALKGLDPVALTQGKEEQGKDEFQFSTTRHTYRFASATNKETFVKNPDQYGIQYAGACAKMGILSGQGSPSRFHVHEGKIYVFASDFCLNAFKKDPAKYIDLPNATPSGTPEQQEEGKRLVQKALAGLGGVEKVKAVNTIQFTTVRKIQNNKTEDTNTNVLSVSFPDAYRIDDLYSNWKGWNFCTAQNGWSCWQTSKVSMEPLERDYFRGSALRHPFVLLRHHAQSGFTAIAAGTGRVLNRDVDYVTIGYQGTTTKLAIDRENGQALEAAFQGRSGTTFGEIVYRFSDFRDVEGLKLPFKRLQIQDGKPGSAPRNYDRILINPPLDNRLFTDPAASIN